MAEKTMNEKEKYLDEIEDKIRTIGVLIFGWRTQTSCVVRISH